MKALQSTARRTSIPTGDDDYSVVWNDEYFEAAGPTTQDESGGSIASVEVLASGAGSAEEIGSGGAIADVTALAYGAGDPFEGASGGAIGGVTVTGFGAGSALEAASGGAIADVHDVQVEAFGEGTADFGEVAASRIIGGGSRRRRTTKFRVEIDGEALWFDTLTEAEGALEAAADLASDLAKVAAIKSASRAVVKIRDGIPVVRVPKIIPPRITIEAPTSEDEKALDRFQAKIRAVYQNAVRVQQAAHQADMDEEDDIIGLLL